MKEPKSPLSLVLGFLGSYTLAWMIFLVLFALTFFGTLEQAHASLQDVRTKYFDSPIFLTEWGIPLPGASFLLGLLFLNLVVGGMIRMRRTWSRVGIFVIHIGIAFLLLSGLVEGLTSKKGSMAVYEGETSTEFKSYYDWDVSILEQLPEGRERVYTIPYERLPRGAKSAVFRADGLPFELELSGFLRNCRPQPVQQGSDAVEGLVFRELPPAEEAENNVPGITAKVISKDVRREALLWGFQQAPYATTIDGRRFAVDLHRRAWPLPYSVTLRKFTHEEHPGTNMPRFFSSDITRVQNNVATDVHISMNDPMRHGGYIFFQSAWGPPNAVPGQPLYSVFSVVENPADHGPLVALIIVAIGLLTHFIPKLVAHVEAEAARRRA
ncbi:MAG TPA: cytochrome c biogenesis protein ResB [Planctomycetota bacterium]|nr:cytochrome c biogenesis protein ResB [Planctomycetota bacterium]